MLARVGLFAFQRHIESVVAASSLPEPNGDAEAPASHPALSDQDKAQWAEP